MGTIAIEKLKEYLKSSLSIIGMNEEEAIQITDIYTRATLRGVGHHDIYDFPGRLNNLRKNIIKINPDIELVSSFGALEVWDGDNGLGEVCTLHALKRAEKLAEEFGIGYATIRHTNHFLAGYPYCQIAVEDGFIAVVYSHTTAAMPGPYGQKHVIGTSPMGFGIPTDDNIILDMCLAACSYADINKKIRNGENIPSHWARDEFGKPTTDPKETVNGKGTIASAAEHKGYSLSILTEILTSVLSGGQMIDQQNENHSGDIGRYTQSVICIDPSKLMKIEDFKGRVGQMKSRMKELDSKVLLPGERSGIEIEKNSNNGFIQVADSTIEELNKIAVSLGVEQL